MNGDQLEARKVFIGLDDIASFIGDWQEGFEENNVSTFSAVHNKNTKYKASKVQYIVNRYRRFAYKFDYFKPGRISSRFKPFWDNYWWNYVFNRAVKECDTFFFIFSTFEWDHKDLKLLKEKYNKKVVVIFCGDEVRWYYSMKQEFERNNFLAIPYEPGYDYSVEGLELRLRYIRNCEKYADVILAQPNVAQLLIRPFNYVHIPIKKSLLNYNTIQNKTKVRVAHAPTSRISKGSDLVLSEINKLKSSGIEFEFVVIENVSAAEVFRLYQSCDIVIDQLYCPGGGKLAHECLAMGKVVLSFMAYDKYNEWLKDCPIVDVNHLTLADELKKVILDHDLRVKLSLEGKEYIRKYHDPKKIVKHVLDLVAENKPEVTPRFFTDDFIPESNEKISVYNKWTEYVKECSWYKDLVRTKQRAGLEF